jgi:clan AA aspartic protease (TIGR02281 family)
MQGMNGDQLANLAYLGLLGAAIAAMFFLGNRQNLGKTAQQAAIWGLIFVGTANTANGTVRTAPVWLASVSLGGMTDTDVRAVVNEGQMDGSLLGMTYLGLFGRIEIADGKLILSR